MDINYLREFVFLAKSCNYNEAAQELFISQSSLSKHIKKLESEIGFPLFNRTTRKVQLNEQGTIFLEFAHKMIDLYEEYSMIFQKNMDYLQRNITIGTIPVMLYYDLTAILASFKMQNDNYIISIIEEDTAQLKEMLKNDKFEFAFIRETDNCDNEFNKIQITDDILVAVFPKNHPLANSESINLGQIRDEKFLFLPPDTLMYDICRRNCKKAGFDPNIVFTDYRGENLSDLAGKGLGIALLTKKPASSFRNDNIAIVDIVPNISTKISFVYKKDTELSPAAECFLNYIKSLSKIA